MVSQAPISRGGEAAQNNRILLDRDFEVFPRRQMQLLADSRRENDLTFLGKHCRHAGKSYIAQGRNATRRFQAIFQRALPPAVLGLSDAV